MYTLSSMLEERCIAIGKAQGVAQDRSLFHCLNSAGRIDDFRRSLDDPDYRETLLREFDLLPDPVENKTDT